MDSRGAQSFSFFEYFNNRESVMLELAYISQEIYFIEYGHDGSQKIPLSMQIPKKSTFFVTTCT
jgi:hypothetical protein